MKKLYLFLLLIAMSYLATSQTFTQTSYTYPPSITEGDRFGRAVDIDGDFIVIGADYYNLSSSAPGYGSAFIWHNDGTSWSEFQQINPPSGYNYDSFGNSVAIHGNNMIIGAVGASTDGDLNPGKVHFYEYDGTTWNHVSEFVSGIASYDIEYGTSVDIQGDYAIVGAIGASSRGGEAYIYYKNAGTWELQETLTHTTTNEDLFGSSVAIHDNIAFVGAYGENTTHIFERTATTWTETGTITPSGTVVTFGIALDYDGENLIIGDEGNNSACIFKYNGTAWDEIAEIKGTDQTSTDHFGCSVKISSNFVVVGAWNKNSTGASYIFKNNAGTWSQTQKITPSNGSGNDRFGASVTIKNSTIIVGGFNHNSTANQSGAIYIYEAPPPPAPEITTQPQNTATCEGATATFSITATNTTSYQWYNTAGVLTDGDDISGVTTNQLSITNTEQADEDTYYCIVTGDGGSLQSNNASLTVDILDVALTGDNITTCVNYAYLSANSPANGLGTWTIIGGSGEISLPNSNTSAVLNLGIGNNIFRWTIVNGACSSSDEMTINYNPLTANAGSDQTITTTSTTLDGSNPSINETGVWTVASGSATFLDASLYNTTVSNLSEGANTLHWTVTNSTCTATDEVIITVELTGGISKINNNYKIIPNPSNGIFIIENKSNENSSVKIYNINGQIIKEFNLNLSENKQINLSEYSAGLYFISIIETKGKTTNFNIIIK